MLSVSRPMTAGEGARYFKADDYYLSEKGRWHGRGAEALGLFGEVRHEDFALALRGLHPGTGETLVAGKGDRHIAGLDLTFSAPKSVSLLVLADPKVKAAHDRAVGRVLAYLETHNAQAREQVDGERRAIFTGNLVVAAFDHMTSRELDPQLHTHAVVLNLTQREEGTWRAVHNVSLYRDQLAFGRLYRAELARNLGEAGYAIRVTDRMQGFFEVRGVPEGFLEAFSQRRQQVEERVQELQRSGEYPHASRARLYEIAALGSRAPKDQGVTKEAVAENWRADLREHGWNIEDLDLKARREAARAREEAEKQAERAPMAGETLRTAVQAKTETESVFRKSEVLDIASRLSLGRFSLDEMEDAFRDLVRSRFLLSLGEHVADAKGTTVEVHTTREMRNLERRILDDVNASRGGWTPLVGAPAVTAHIAAQEKAQGWTYTKGQKEAIRVLLTSRDGVNLVQGDAGTGKTASLAVVREVAERKGVQVLGLGFTGKAARELQDGAGIASLTLDCFLTAEVRIVEPGQGRGRAEAQGGGLTLERGSLLVVDEASMAGSRHFGELLRLARDGGLKLAVVGDRKQFPSIAAGRTLAILQDRGRVDQVQMTEVLRQTTEPMKALVQAASRGEQSRVFNLLEAAGALHEIRTKDERIGAVVGDYLERIGEGKRTLILTATNRDRQAINDRVRQALQARGRLKGGRPFSVVEPVSLAPEHAVRAEAYRPGQVLVVTRPLGPGLLAGRRVEVLSGDPERNVLTVRAGTRTAAIDPAADHGKLSVYARVEREFAEGDRIVFRKNDRRLGVQNGLTATVTGIDGRGRFEVQLDRGGRLRFLVDDPGRNQSRRSSARYDAIDHAYALTEYKSQGATVDRVLWHADTTGGRITRNAFYVAATPAREGFTVYTDDKEALKERIGLAQEKMSTLDHAPPGHDERRGRRERDADRQPSGGRPAGPAAGERAGKELERDRGLELSR